MDGRRARVRFADRHGLNLYIVYESQRRAGAEGRDPHDSGGDVRSSRSKRKAGAATSIIRRTLPSETGTPSSPPPTRW